MRSLFYTLFTALVGVAAISPASPAHAQTYPNKPITLINPYAVGGPVDLLSRALAKGLTENLKQPVVVVSKPGGGASIGAAYVAQSAPDGYTLLLGTAAAHYITPYSTKTTYTLKDFKFVGMIDNASNVLVVNPSVPARNLKEFIALAKASPGKLNYGTSGNGTSPHIGTELLKARAGIDLVHVPYGGAAPAVTDLVGGQVQVGLINASGVLPFIRSGKLRALAIASKERSKLLPNVPTFTEAGLPGFVSGSWHSLAAPAGTPQPIVDRLAQALAAVQATREFQALLEPLATDPFVLGPAETTTFIHDEAAHTIQMFTATHIQLK